MRDASALPAASLGGLALACLATAALPAGPRWEAVLALIILFGVPHGALDGEVARPWLRPRLGRWWLPVFAAPYLLLAALVLVLWRVSPLSTLAGFLALSAWHFGSEDAGAGRPVEALARGGLPIAVPALAHPAEVADVLASASGVPLDAPPVWLAAACWAWLPLAATWAVRAAMERRWPALAEAGGLLAAFLLLPPLTAFGLYFVCVHAPRHMAALAADPARAPRVQGWPAAILRSLPLSLLTYGLGIMLWPLYAGPTPERLAALTLQGLAALTLPHVILGWLLDFGMTRQGRVPNRGEPPGLAGSGGDP